MNRSPPAPKWSMTTCCKHRPHATVSGATGLLIDQFGRPLDSRELDGCWYYCEGGPKGSAQQKRSRTHHQ